MKKIIFIFAMICSPVTYSQSVENIKIGSNDILEVFVVNSSELSKQIQVAFDGSITLPLIGKVMVSDSTVSEIEYKIQQKLKRGGFLKKPAVSVSLLNSASNQVTVLGEVASPGKYPISQNLKNIFDLLAIAGGVNPMSNVVIVRNKNGKFSRINVDVEALLVDGKDEDLLDSNLNLLKGDFVYVKQAPVFYTFGETGNTMLPLKNDLLLQQAIVMSGGFTKLADDDNVKIKREISKGKYKLIEVSLDTIVKENDIIIVDESLF